MISYLKKPSETELALLNKCLKIVLMARLTILRNMVLIIVRQELVLQIKVTLLQRQHRLPLRLYAQPVAQATTEAVTTAPTTPPVAEPVANGSSNSSVATPTESTSAKRADDILAMIRDRQASNVK